MSDALARTDANGGGGGRRQIRSGSFGKGRAADRHVSEAELVRAAVHTEPTG
jgi:hypothetical protein